MMEPDTTVPEWVSRFKGRKMYKNLQLLHVSESLELVFIINSLIFWKTCRLSYNPNYWN